MKTILLALMLVAMLAALVVVLIGVLNMARTSDAKDRARQNKLMQYRVGFQALALALAFLAFVLLAA
ncbi:MAG: HIG1 domain-containing protein [Rhodothalassiaceae bacterium]